MSDGAGLGGTTLIFSLGKTKVRDAETGNDGVATINKVLLKGFGAGPHAGAVQARFEGDDDYAASTGSGTLTVAKADQDLLSVKAPDRGVYGKRLTMSASGGSGDGELTFTVLDDSDACSIAEGRPDKLRITQGTGVCRIQAKKAGDQNYNSAVSEPHVVSTAKAAQAPLIVTGPHGGTEGKLLELTASGGSGDGEPTFTVLDDSDACSIVEGRPDKLRITHGTRVCRIQAKKAGDENYNPAVSEAHPVSVSAAPGGTTADDGGHDWVVPALIAALALAALAALGGGWLAR